MEKVLNQAEMLAEAILESEEYITMRLSEQAAMRDTEATGLIAAYTEKRLQNLLMCRRGDRQQLRKSGNDAV